jgi:hypothetical protein
MRKCNKTQRGSLLLDSLSCFNLIIMAGAGVCSFRAGEKAKNFRHHHDMTFQQLLPANFLAKGIPFQLIEEKLIAMKFKFIRKSFLLNGSLFLSAREISRHGDRFVAFPRKQSAGLVDANQD